MLSIMIILKPRLCLLQRVGGGGGQEPEQGSAKGAGPSGAYLWRSQLSPMSLMIVHA